MDDTRILFLSAIVGQYFRIYYVLKKKLSALKRGTIQFFSTLINSSLEFQIETGAIINSFDSNNYYV